MNKEELEVINFTNITDKEWVGQWAQESYVFKPGETKSYPRFMSEHFAKHLIDRILIDQGKDYSLESPFRNDLKNKILGRVAVPAEELHPAEKATMNELEFEEAPVEVAEEVPAEPAPVAPKKRGRRKIA